MQYFIDKEIYFHGKLEPPTKVKLIKVIKNMDNITALCYDEDWNDYNLNIKDILED